MMFLDEQFELADKYKDKTEFKCLKFRVHVVLGKKDEDVWSLVKIFQVLGISKEVLFEGMLQNSSSSRHIQRSSSHYESS